MSSEPLLRPLLVSNLTPLTAMYVDGQGATAGVVGQTELGRLSRRELEQDALAKFVRNDQAGTYGEKRWTVYCECGWLEDAHTKELARSEHRWHVRQVKQTQRLRGRGRGSTMSIELDTTIPGEFTYALPGGFSPEAPLQGLLLIGY